MVLKELKIQPKKFKWNVFESKVQSYSSALKFVNKFRKKTKVRHKKVHPHDDHDTNHENEIGVNGDSHGKSLLRDDDDGDGESMQKSSIPLTVLSNELTQTQDKSWKPWPGSSFSQSRQRL